jgi:hypothetical protein
MPHPELHSPARRSNDLNETGDDSNPFDPPQSSLPSKKLRRPSHVKSISTPHAWAASSKYNDFVPTYSLPRPSTYDIDNGLDSLTLESDSIPVTTPKPELINTVLPRDGVARAIALYDFAAVEVMLGSFD